MKKEKTKEAKTPFVCAIPPYTFIIRFFDDHELHILTSKEDKAESFTEKYAAGTSKDKLITPYIPPKKLMNLLELKTKMATAQYDDLDYVARMIERLSGDGSFRRISREQELKEWCDKTFNKITSEYYCGV